jgi:hypothetical protein
MYEYDLNKDFDIDVEESSKGNAWEMASLNIDLVIKKDAVDDAKNNKYLACKDFVGYLSNINKANIELMEVHNKILIVAKNILEGK